MARPDHDAISRGLRGRCARPECPKFHPSARAAQTGDGWARYCLIECKTAHGAGNWKTPGAAPLTSVKDEKGS